MFFYNFKEFCRELLIEVEKEFLLAIANNSFDLSQRLSTLIEDCCKTNVMTEKEAYEAIRKMENGADVPIVFLSGEP